LIVPNSSEHGVMNGNAAFTPAFWCVPRNGQGKMTSQSRQDAGATTFIARLRRRGIDEQERKFSDINSFLIVTRSLSLNKMAFLS
jgi:hypothetical protein